ncbi:hypothetical protein ZIOFF_010549 [Zingiber officinale]|uniref:Membrane-associated kinase regulator 1 n=1 Tax=Zingiber officinale TaxID=94328 RepID=A0A8J5LS59_ZINOF|nr:hypothetical protein ZIOFF_010549 [Zingiber officinale]
MSPVSPFFSSSPYCTSFKPSTVKDGHGDFGGRRRCAGDVVFPVSVVILLLRIRVHRVRLPIGLENDLGRLPASAAKRPTTGGGTKYLSSLATRFSSAFLHRGGSKKFDSVDVSPAAPLMPVSKRAMEVIKKYVKKVKPIYEMLPAMQQRKKKTTAFSFSDRLFPGKKNTPAAGDNAAAFPQSSFSGNLLDRHPPARKKRWAASCPSSMRSSPSHSGLLYAGAAPPAFSLPSSSAEELQSAIQGAIAHCKSSLTRSTNHDEIAARS